MSLYLQSFLSSPGWGPRGMASIGGEACLLGIVFGASVILSVVVASLRPFLVFCALLSLFHMTEFLFAAVYHSYTCSTESFLIPHSTGDGAWLGCCFLFSNLFNKAYSIAMAFCAVEYFVELFLFGSSFKSHALFYIGFCITVAVSLGNKVIFRN
jgi:hypothetical protein